MHDGPSEPLIDTIAMLSIALGIGLLAFKDWFYRRIRRPKNAAHPAESSASKWFG